VAVSFNDGHAKTTTNTYNNDQANWLLCQLTRAEVLSQEPGGGSSTRVSSWTYDGVGRIATEVIEPDLPQFTLTTGYTYDAFGNRLSQTTSGAGIETRTTSQTYDAQGRFVVSTTNALGHTETYVRDPAHGGLLSQTGPNGLTTTWSYDGLGRKLGETRADGTTSTITYALAGSGYSITNQTSGAASSTVFYDILERTISTATEGFDGTLIYQDTQYDTLGRVAQTSSPYFSGATPNWSVPAYDALGRVTSVTTPGNRTTTTTYDGLTTTVTNPLGQTKTAVKNSQDKVTSVTDDAGPLSYQYDAFGNLLQVTDPGGNINAMQYDIRGRKVAMQDPDMGSWTYQYNVLGELVSQTDAKGQTTTMVYDKLGRMESRTTLEGTSSWAYDSGLYSVGKLVQVTGPGPYRQLHTYDSLGRPSAVTTQFEGGSYTTQTTYDAFSRVATTEYPTGFRTRNVYNNTGHLQQILDDNLNALFWQANAVNARGRLTSETFGNGVNTQVEFDPTTGDLARIYSLGGSETLQDLNYLFDAIGNLTSINDARQGLTETFVYDALNRMTSVSGVVAKSFAYDNLGNMTHKSDVGDYTYGENGAGPHAVSSTSGTINKRTVLRPRSISDAMSKSRRDR
jgi:YD repeat-containing protein